MKRFLPFLFLSLCLAACRPDKPNASDAPMEVTREGAEAVVKKESQTMADVQKTAALEQAAHKTERNGKAQKPTLQPAKDKPVVEDETPQQPPPPPAPKKEAAQPGALPPPAPAATRSAAGKPDHTAWNDLLQAYVSPTGLVNYGGLRGARAKLEGYLGQLAATPPRSDWSRQEAMAYWINAYNAYTVKLILDNYPVKSIKDIHGGEPWQVKWIELGTKKYSLNQIENDILRPLYKDPRIHFALNCAAKSCPPLYNRAFTAANLNGTLEQLTRAFINNPKFNTLQPGSAEVSRIFDWYGGDFGNLTGYLNKYATTRLEDSAAITFKSYDWDLNGG
jgi:hypothetical protein